MYDRQTNTTYLKVGITNQPYEVRLQQEINSWNNTRYIWTRIGYHEFQSRQEASRHEEAIIWRLRNFLPENLRDPNGTRRREFFIDNENQSSEICDQYLNENGIPDLIEEQK
tara:strand:- start:549 stop:884 length:336 start_codon:yes stop_codon:yes gene_type:complete